jgi:hypothetical protein
MHKATFDSPVEAAQYVFKFGLLVGIGAILTDAIVAHGLFWDNDPYWTYWVTKTLLITTVFTLGTSLFGIGIKQGLGITLAHTAILEVYYQWFAPVGLPQEPEWLDINHVWITGTPAHYLAILTGYLTALWIWRRNALPESFRTETSPRSIASVVLVTCLLALLLDGALTFGIIRHEFPGITYFIQHLLVAFVVTFAWSAFVGFERLGWLIGAIGLSFIWLGYDMYLGPIGLPASIRYLTYEELWFQAFPGGLVAALIGFYLAPRAYYVAEHRRLPAVTTALLLMLLVPALSRAEGLPASTSSSGSMMLVTGPEPTNMNSAVMGEGSINVSVVEKGNRWSHVQNTDAVDVKATFVANGVRWEVNISKPMPRHPLGKYTTWNGVVFNHEMHGNTGIGSGKIPRVKPEIALWGWAEVKKDGEVVSMMAPAHVMVMRSGATPGIMLEVATEDKSLLAAPDGYLTAIWHTISEERTPSQSENSRKMMGWFALILAPAMFWWLAAREKRFE